MHDKIPHVVLGGGDKGGATVMPLLSNNQTPRECIKRPVHSNAKTVVLVRTPLLRNVDVSAVLIVHIDVDHVQYGYRQEVVQRC